VVLAPLFEIFGLFKNCRPLPAVTPLLSALPGAHSPYQAAFSPPLSRPFYPLSSFSPSLLQTRPPRLPSPNNFLNFPPRLGFRADRPSPWPVCTPPFRKPTLGRSLFPSQTFSPEKIYCFLMENPSFNEKTIGLFFGFSLKRGQLASLDFVVSFFFSVEHRLSFSPHLPPCVFPLSGQKGSAVQVIFEVRASSPRPPPNLARVFKKLLFPFSFLFSSRNALVLRKCLKIEQRPFSSPPERSP